MPIDLFTAGDAARRLGLSRAVVNYAIDRAQIQPAGRAGLVRLFTPDQWVAIVNAVKATRAGVPLSHEQGNRQ